MKEKRTWDKKVILRSVLCFVAGGIVGIGSVKLPAWWKNRTNVVKVQTEEKGYDAVEAVKLGEYKGIEVTLTPTEEELQAEIDSFLEEHAEFERIKGTAKDGDRVHVKISASAEGEPVDIAEAEDDIDLGSGLYLEAIEQGFIGMKTGEKKKIPVTVPAGYYRDDSIDGKEAVFTLRLDYICGETLLPDYNDEFVQAATSYHSVKEYNAYLKQKLKEENQEDKIEYAWSQVIETSEVDDGDYPKTLLEEQKQEVLQGYYDMAAINGVTHDEIFMQFGCEDEQDFIDTELEELAKDGAKDVLIAQAIAVKEHLFYTEKEYKSVLNAEYKNNQELYTGKKEYEEKNKAYLENTALIEKVKSFIDQHAKYV